MREHIDIEQQLVVSTDLSKETQWGAKSGKVRVQADTRRRVRESTCPENEDNVY